jgi:hypothetical protein
MEPFRFGEHDVPAASLVYPLLDPFPNLPFSKVTPEQINQKGCTHRDSN